MKRQPDEHVDLADAGARVRRRLIENFRPRALAAMGH
jgi:hypothetical protein